MNPRVQGATNNPTSLTATAFRALCRAVWRAECLPMLLRLQHDSNARVAAEARALLRRAKAMGAPCESESTND